MRTPAQIARLLGWPETQHEPLLAVPGSTLHADGRVTPPGWQPPKLIVRPNAPGRWLWVIGTWTGSGKAVIAPRSYGHAPTHAQALAVGLAALETASVEHRPQVHAQPVDNLGGWR